ncbi:MAG: sigma-70 family RNA polymerase sigma factor [Planctomycetota bacterium]
MEDIFRDQTDSELLRGLRHPADAAAFHRFFKSYYKPLWSYFQLLCPDQDAAQDWCNSFCVYLYRKLPGPPSKVPKGKFRRYLVRMARNFVAERLKSRHKREKQFDSFNVALYASPISSTRRLEACLDEGTEIFRIQTALDRVRALVSERDWDVFESSVLREESVGAVAKRHQIRQHSVYQIRIRIRKKIARELGECE